MAESICACCGKDLPNNPTVCPHCDEVPPEVEPYTKGLWCNDYCRDRDAKKHQPRCRERIQLRSFLRAAHLLQDLFFIFREASFSRPITSVSSTPKASTNDILSFQQAGYNDAAPIRPDSPVYRLPECLKGDSENVKQRRQSILAFLCCDESVVWMYRLIKWALLDTQIASKIDEIQILPRQDPTFAPLAIRATLADKRVDNTVDFSHTFCQVQLLPDGDPKTHYVLDLSGAQYGWHDSVFPFDRYIIDNALSKAEVSPDNDDDDDDRNKNPYKETYLGKLIWRGPHGTYHNRSQEEVEQDMKSHKRDHVTSKFAFKASESFYTGIRDLIRNNKVFNLGKWFESPEEVFQTEMKDVLERAKGIAVDVVSKYEGSWAVESARVAEENEQLAAPCGSI